MTALNHREAWGNDRAEATVVASSSGPAATAAGLGGCFGQEVRLAQLVPLLAIELGAGVRDGCPCSSSFESSAGFSQRVGWWRGVQTTTAVG
jgi:hypothetical protein